jgi:hypothetical protein
MRGQNRYKERNRGKLLRIDTLAAGRLKMGQEVETELAQAPPAPTTPLTFKPLTAHEVIGLQSDNEQEQKHSGVAFPLRSINPLDAVVLASGQ